MQVYIVTRTEYVESFFLGRFVPKDYIDAVFVNETRAKNYVKARKEVEPEILFSIDDYEVRDGEHYE